MSESYSKNTRAKPRAAGFLFAIVVLLGLGSASAQIPVFVEPSCACAPSAFEFTLDFGQTCSDDLGAYYGNNPGSLNGYGCSNNLPDYDFATDGIIEDSDNVLVSVSRVRFREFGQAPANVLLSDSDLNDNYSDGDTVPFTSAVATQSVFDANSPDKLQIDIYGLNAEGERLELSFTYNYSNDCSVFPIFTEGDTLGWATVTSVTDPPASVCPLVNIGQCPNGAADCDPNAECDQFKETSELLVCTCNPPFEGNGTVCVEPVPVGCSCKKDDGLPDCSDCGGHGDPHFKTWTGDKYDFHGECDLVLLQNPEFNAGLGMHVHIRTKAWGRYSSIETAAVRIGEDTLEVQANGDQTHHWINGVAQAELPSTLSGFPIEYTEVGTGRKKQRFYTISLDNDEKIVVNTIKKLVQVLFKNAGKDSFISSGGLMGDYETGGRVARDGKTVIKKWDPFGQEWQVRPSDPSLFQVVDGPQHPDKCVMPLVTSKATKQRRLSESGVGEVEAAKACARVALADRDECIFDVLATGDIEMVYIYETATAGVH